MPSIFISYRRDDTGGHAGRLAEALTARFGPTRVFMDIDSIAVGVDFEQATQQWMAGCDLVLVLVGPRWLSARLPDGTRRIDAADDLVRQEVRTALSLPGVTVVPVLVEGAAMPEADELPSDIASLPKHNAFDLSNKRWQYDVAQLMRVARRHDKVWWRLLYRTPRLALRLGPVVAVALAAAIVLLLATSGPSKASRLESCERTHAMPGATASRTPRPGESQFHRSSLLQQTGSEPTFQQTSYASCSWPPPSGADPDGYRAITVTLTNGPGQTDGSGRDFADVIEAPCKRLRLVYREAFMGDQRRATPFVGDTGDIWAGKLSGTTIAFAFTGRIGSSAEQQLQLPFYPPSDAVVVLHSQQVLDSVSCTGAS